MPFLPRLPHLVWYALVASFGLMLLSAPLALFSPVAAYEFLLLALRCVALSLAAGALLIGGVIVFAAATGR